MSEEIKKGLLGIVVDETTISHVVPELSALTYRGYTVQELCDKCDFEEVASDLAIENGYDYVICGHIHQPKILIKENKFGKTMYLNSGDWVENFTALEYQFKRWKIYNYNKDKLSPFFADEDIKEMEIKDLIAAITIVEPEKKKKKKLN